jgi:acetyl esterase/lipase
MKKISIQARILKRIFRHFIKPMLVNAGGVEDLKIASRGEGPISRWLSRIIPKADEKIMIDHIYAEWLGDTNAKGALLYLHGGAFLLGSPKSHRGLVKNITKSSSFRALSIDYRLAPKHKFPAALEDAEKAYDWLLQTGYAPENIAVAGDSAGGCLTLALLLKLKEVGKPLPACAVTMSPWTDLTGSGASIRLRNNIDDMLDGSKLTETASLYHGDTPATHPLVSPLFADLKNLPPLLIQVGTDEILWDDACSFAEKAIKAGNDCTLEIYENMPHVFQLGADFVPESKEAVKKITTFINDKIN